VTDQGHPPREPDYPGQGGEPDYQGQGGRSRAPQQVSRGGWQVLDAFAAGTEHDAEPPPWATPDRGDPARRPPDGQGHAEDASREAAAPGGGGPRRGRRAAASRRRRSRRRLVAWGALTIVLVIAIGAVYYFAGRPAAQPGSATVSTLQSGEYRQVPDACRMLSGSLLRTDLNGTPASIQPYDDLDQSQCTYTVDNKPTFRVLNLMMQAYQPFPGLIPGNGGATANAIYNFGQLRQQLARPPKHTPQPAAQISPVGGLGDSAFSAAQAFHAAGFLTDRVTVVVRYRNVLISAYFQAQENGGFSPVPSGQLSAGALAAAREMLAKVKSTPSVS
jgi:hypothetical protein